MKQYRFPNLSGLNEWLIQRFEHKQAIEQTALQFAPAALEVAETPAHPASRLLIKVVGLLFLAAVAWACIGKIDIVATAQGKIIPGARVKSIQSMSSGEIEQIHVQEGDMVREGDILVTLTGVITGAELNKLKRQHQSLLLQIAREEAFHRYLMHAQHAAIEGMENLQIKLSAIDYSKLSKDWFEARLLSQKIEEYGSTLQVLRSQKKQ
ncbi:biotin/lipoyl-binding protein [Endozoicomonas sp. GU-1]|uniref:biotin/lipoyl-binding protein n=1 Tax=Endozoicomonas sp. GU-1 TaxID=3009078 RepID=UPI0022B33800|nr:biotin/lipoyl-binding protein [Endozoicomonas sp. GU-1]WBA81433.1 biotin/lipoyl-binding protein [Endozoicomonas sp. GU-1]WBA84380.1 biotin/lipoyl-binding protein [Endozoicomonas sp. GU-1]